MPTQVTVADPGRIRAGGSVTPADFADIAPVESMEWLSGGVLALTFTGSLTPEQRLRVRVRCVARDAAEEALLTDAAQAYYANLDYIALPSPTTAQALAQVRTLTQQVNGLLRYVTGL